MNRRLARTSSHSFGTGFRALFYGSLITNTGDGIRLAALPLLAAQLTSSPFVVATVTAAQYLPWLTFAPVGGVVVDRWDRRRVIIGTQAFPTGVQRPVARSLQQRLTPNDLLGRVNISARALTRGVIIIGALSSGAVASAVGVRWAFAMGGAVELTAAVAMWRALNAVDDRKGEPRPPA